MIIEVLSLSTVEVLFMKLLRKKAAKFTTYRMTEKLRSRSSNNNLTLEKLPGVEAGVWQGEES